MSGFKNSKPYLHIIQTICDIKKGRPITQEWISIQADLIREYRNFCDDFSTIEEEIEDTEFRQAANSVEKLLTSLCEDLYFSKPFHLERFYQLMLAMEKLCCAFITEHEIL